MLYKNFVQQSIYHKPNKSKIELIFFPNLFLP